MKRFTLAALVFLAAATAANAQVAQSVYTPLNPCALFDSRIATGTLGASSTTWIKARGACNIPQTANALALTVVAVDPYASGEARVLESSLPSSTAQSVLHWKSGAGSTSGNPIVRLCYPVEECSTEDLQVWVSAETHFTISVSGFFEPVQ